LRLADVLLVANALVAKPVGNLRDGDAALSGQLFLRLFGRIWIAEVAIEVFVEDFRRLLAEVSSLATSV
jgi:hypothetical protein